MCTVALASGSQLQPVSATLPEPYSCACHRTVLLLATVHKDNTHLALSPFLYFSARHGVYVAAKCVSLLSQKLVSCLLAFLGGGRVLISLLTLIFSQDQLRRRARRSLRPAVSLLLLPNHHQHLQLQNFIPAILPPIII